MRTLIKDGHLIDPANQKNGKFDLLINKGQIEAVEPKGKLKNIADSVNKLVVPLGLLLAAKYLSKRRKKKSKKQKGGFIRGGSDQFFYNPLEIIFSMDLLKKFHF